MGLIIVTHGGAGSPLEYKDGTEKAAKKGYSVLRKKGNAVDAVIHAVVVLENDHRFNAGTGSKMRLDGSVEMDAAVMTSDLRCGAVAGIKNVKNPVKVARKVMRTPHVLLAGEGATSFARKNSFRYYNPVTKEALRKLEDAKNKLKNGKIPGWAKKWDNFEYKKVTGTVGAVARDKKRFVVAVSTGGTSFMLPGRVGDSALIGCGIYAGRHGAVCATGVGEEIIRHVLSKSVYDKINTLGPQKASEWGVSLLKGFPTGLIAVSKDGYGIACSENMACTVVSKNLLKSGVP